MPGDENPFVAARQVVGMGMAKRMARQEHFPLPLSGNGMMVRAYGSKLLVAHAAVSSFPAHVRPLSQCISQISIRAGMLDRPHASEWLHGFEPKSPPPAPCTPHQPWEPSAATLQQ